jgi:hypothetical protein
MRGHARFRGKRGVEPSQAMDAHARDLRLVVQLGEPVAEPLTTALVATRCLLARERDELLVRAAVLRERSRRRAASPSRRARTEPPSTSRYGSYPP